MTNLTDKPTLPALSLDYSTGTFTNTLTGETAHEVTGVVLASREDRVLWPGAVNPDPRPECVNGSKFGPCTECQFAHWSPSGQPPVCTQELSFLLWQDEGGQLVTLTGRRTQLKVLDSFLGTKALTSGVLHDQRVTVGMKPDGGLHRLIVLPGAFLEQGESDRLGAVAQRAVATGAFEAL